MRDPGPVEQCLLACHAHLRAEPRAWIKRDLHALVRFDGEAVQAYCALGLLSAHADSDLVLMKAAKVLEEAVGYPSVGTWNDADERRFEEVLEGFARAVTLAKVREL